MISENQIIEHLQRIKEDSTWHIVMDICEQDEPQTVRS